MSTNESGRPDRRWATTSPDGSMSRILSWHSAVIFSMADPFTPPFPVLLWPDNDVPGRHRRLGTRPIADSRQLETRCLVDRAEPFSVGRGRLQSGRPTRCCHHRSRCDSVAGMSRTASCPVTTSGKECSRGLGQRGGDPGNRSRGRPGGHGHRNHR